MGGMRNMAAPGPKDEMKLEKNAGLIMGTNNSSIVSKRSVERLYLPQPHFYRYFVRKPQRRSPTINRGYWLRMRAIEHTVRLFLERPSLQQKVILNLGAGYEPLAFQWLATEPSKCKNVRFIDVDYEELMISKRDIIMSTPNMRGFLTGSSNAPVEGIVLDSEQYVAIGCDLRNIKRLNRLISSVASLEQCLVLCIAEVSITYMDPEAADAVIKWSAKLSPDVTFCLVEQKSPDRLDHPFTATMIRHFAKLGTPLKSIGKYPGMHTEIARFLESGFHKVDAQSLWDFWCRLLPSQRLALDHIEPFDEWEEFALFASHYGLYIAQNSETPLSPTTDLENGHRQRRDSCTSLDSDFSTRTASPIRYGTQIFGYRYCPNPEGEGLAHHASAYTPCNDEALALYGGVGPQKRITTTFVYAPSHTKAATPMILPDKIAARCCHTIQTLGDGNSVLIGGRASPAQPMKDCWIQTDTGWERIHDLPKPRYRHRAAPVNLPFNEFGLVVFGGKNGPSEVDCDTLLWSPKEGWTKLKSLKQDPVPRFGNVMVTLGNNHGFMFGGMRQDGVICQGFWRWRLIIRGGVVAGISFRESTALDVSVGTWPMFARFGASYSIIRNEILITGGIGKLGCIPKPYEILSISGSLSALAETGEHEMDLKVACVDPISEPDQPRPLLIGHSSYRTRTDQTLIMGGGATCFSFGSYWNKGVWLLYDREAGLSTNWRLLKTPKEYFTVRQLVQKPSMNGEQKLPISSTKALKTSFLKDHTLQSIFEASIPRLLTQLDLGPCLKLWTSDYLKSKIPSTRQVVVHQSESDTMNFQRKDFSYTTMPFHNFLDLCSSGQHLYLRSLSSSSPSSTPANFFFDFPELASDLQLPYSLLPILNQQDTYHSSPLRISSNLNMWLHYDVMSNILFQIRGVKRLILFPPSDIKHLNFPPGATTSRLDIHPDSPYVPQTTHPVLATLNPGDALYIPPLWSHAASSLPLKLTSTPIDNPKSTFGHTSDDAKLIIPSTDHLQPSTGPHNAAKEDPTTISLNIFFRTLSPSHAAAGRDVYGNRDLAAYEDGRRDVDRIVKRFLKSTTATHAAQPKTQPPSSNPHERAEPEQPNGTQAPDTHLDGATDQPTDDHNGDSDEYGPLETLSRVTTATQIFPPDKTNSAASSTPIPSKEGVPPPPPPPLKLSPTIPKQISKAYLERLGIELLQRAAEL